MRLASPYRTPVRTLSRPWPECPPGVVGLDPRSVEAAANLSTVVQKRPVKAALRSGCHRHVECEPRPRARESLRLDGDLRCGSGEADGAARDTNAQGDRHGNVEAVVRLLRIVEADAEAHVGSVVACRCRAGGMRWA